MTVTPWKQIGGDMHPGAHGAVIARYHGKAIEIREIHPVITNVGEDEAREVGFPFWSKEAYYDPEDLDPSIPDVRSALKYRGLDLNEVEPQHRMMAIAECCLSYGYRTDEGPSGWAKDVVPGMVKWWGADHPQGWRYLASDDQEFRRLLKENR